jgi:hypothetical protein
MTLLGILKRLGRTDVKEQIDIAKQQEEKQHQKNTRNNKRKQIREASQELYDLLVSTDAQLSEQMNWDPDGGDIKFFARLKKLTELKDEE